MTENNKLLIGGAEDKAQHTIQAITIYAMTMQAITIYAMTM